MDPQSHTPGIDRSAPPATRADAEYWKHTVVRVAPFAAFIGVLAITPLLTQRWAASDAQLVAWLHASRAMVAAALMLLFWRCYSELRAPQPVRAGTLGLSAALGALVYVLWIHLDAPWMTLGEQTRFDPTSPEYGSHGLAVTAVRFLGLALVVPVMEELFWRSFVMRWLAGKSFLDVDPSRVGHFAFWATAALFALEHKLWLAGLIAGIAFNWLYMHARSLWAPVVAHVVANVCLGIHIIYFERWDLW